jgi:hypothetical protein
MYKAKNIKDFIECQLILENAVSDFNSGKTFSYKTIGIELRKLLCDTKGKKDISIFARMFPGIQMRPLYGYSFPESLKEGLVCLVPMKMNYDGKGGMIASLSLDANCLVYRNEWLDQSVLFQSLTIRNLIRSVSDREGAHSDFDIDSSIAEINGIKMGPEDTHKYLIVAIGEYIGIVIKQIIESQKLREKFSYLFNSNY